ncbi:MAG: hypothetical protein AAGI07_19910 [Bacteroidota bacterium]
MKKQTLPFTANLSTPHSFPIIRNLDTNFALKANISVYTSLNLSAQINYSSFPD